jgi:hypothetical protein
MVTKQIQIIGLQTKGSGIGDGYDVEDVGVEDSRYGSKWEQLVYLNPSVVFQSFENDAFSLKRDTALVGLKPFVSNFREW